MRVRLLPKSPVYMHAKAEISGDEAFIGSENYSVSSLNENREMGLILHGGPDTAKPYQHRQMALSD